MVEWNEQIDPGEFNNVANNFPQLVLPLFSICNEAPNIIMQNFQTLLIYKINLLAVNWGNVWQVNHDMLAMLYLLCLEACSMHVLV